MISLIKIKHWLVYLQKVDSITKIISIFSYLLSSVIIDFAGCWPQLSTIFLWYLIGLEMEKYHWESPLPAGLIGGGQPWQSHTPPYPHLVWMVHKANLHNCGSEFHLLFTHYLNKCVKFLKLGPIWALRHFSVVSLSRPVSASRNIPLEKSRSFNKLSSALQTPELMRPLSWFL